MPMPAVEYKDGPDIAIRRLVVFKLVTRSARLVELDRLGAAQLLVS